MRSRADSPARSLVVTAALLSLATALGYVEAVLVPPLPIGARIGIANVVVVIALSALGPRRALAISIGRVVAVGLATGMLAGPASLMAGAGAIAAWLAMIALRSRGATFSVVGWSVAGAAAHVLAQLAIASTLVGSPAPLALAPLALLLSLAAGLATGALAAIVIARSPSILSRPLATISAKGTGEVSGGATPKTRTV